MPDIFFNKIKKNIFPFYHQINSEIDGIQHHNDSNKECTPAFTRGNSGLIITLIIDLEIRLTCATHTPIQTPWWPRPSIVPHTHTHITHFLCDVCDGAVRCVIMMNLVNDRISVPGVYWHMSLQWVWIVSKHKSQIESPDIDVSIKDALKVDWAQVWNKLLNLCKDDSRCLFA